MSKNNIHIQGTKQVDTAPGLEQESAMRRNNPVNQEVSKVRWIKSSR